MIKIGKIVFLILLILFLLAMASKCYMMLFVHSKEITTKKYNVVSIQHVSGTEGYYTVYIKDKNGDCELKRYNVDEVKIRFDARDNNSAFVEYSEYGNGLLKDKYILHVPQNTIQEKFDLN